MYLCLIRTESRLRLERSVCWHHHGDVGWAVDCLALWRELCLHFKNEECRIYKFWNIWLSSIMSHRHQLSCWRTKKRIKLPNSTAQAAANQQKDMAELVARARAQTLCALLPLQSWSMKGNNSITKIRSDYTQHQGQRHRKGCEQHLFKFDWQAWAQQHYFYRETNGIKKSQSLINHWYIKQWYDVDG